MRSKTLVHASAKFATLGLILIALGAGHTALAQQKPAPEPVPAASPPAQQSPAIAPVPMLPQRPKAEETAPRQGPKEETSAQIKMRRGAVPVTEGAYDVGVIPGSGWCPPGSELIMIYMDDEDHQNANSRSGWIGAIVSDNNTRFVFCRVDGSKFGPSVAPYAVLKLSPQCPLGSFSFSRYFDNEDNYNQNGASGNIAPNTSSFYGVTATQLYFCLFPPQASSPSPFPDLGLEYGVFAANLPGVGLANGHLHTDDEDDSNENYFDLAYTNMGSLASQIIWGDRNTDISIVKVKNAPPPPPHCLPKAVSWNGSPVNATWDGANCYIKAVVAGATPFIWNNGYYVTADKLQMCLLGTGTWDTANCYFMPKPAGGFLYNDAFYVPPGPGNTCPAGSTFDTANCLIKAAPWTTHAFEYQNNWYFTPPFQCKDGSYDSANCYVMKAPAGHLAFIYNNAYYYKE